PGGVNGGGRGGTVEQGDPNGIRHHGTGGGGWTEVRLGGETAIVAGGGGGLGGGHSINTGLGGDGGLPVGAGVTLGANGLDGLNGQNQPGTPGGAQGGQESAPGLGGVHSSRATLNGSMGDGRTGGNGGPDQDLDSGGGGGGGYYGGGGGAGTIVYGTGAPVQDGVTGAGGGGGASYINPDGPISGPEDITSVAGPRVNNGNGPNGDVRLEWVLCGYDLEVDKQASPENAPAGSTVTWTVSVTNNFPTL
ncbi:PREDICTED: glycine-rich protein 23-like, partial [Cyphomyrmex costatus]|uniref:glycine-rich protein 23-like n=1 Tax=Cyphomyrmex costatus TaxID=456900 RepID=UPI0008523D24